MDIDELVSRPGFRPAVDRVVDGLDLIVERVESLRADTLSPSARTRNGYREAPGARVRWRVKLAEPDPVLDYAIEWETPSIHETRKAAVGAVEDVREAIRREFASPIAWIDTDWAGSCLPEKVAEVSK